VRAFDYDYGGIGTKQSMFVNTEVYDKRIALIICGWGKNNRGIYSFWNDANYTYWTLRTKGFSDDNIYFLYCNGMHDNRTNYYGTQIDGPATKANINNICGTIGSKSTTNSLVFVAVISHGWYSSNNDTSYFGLKLDENNQSGSDYADELVWATEFGNSSTMFLGKITNYKRMVFMSCACSSGGFIKELKGYLSNGTRDKRVCITSTFDKGQEAHYNLDYDYSAFYYYFISAFNGTGLYGNGTVKVYGGYTPITADASDDKDTICSLAEAFNWSYPLIYYNAWVSGDICNYNDLHNCTWFQYTIFDPNYPGGQIFLPLNETRCASGYNIWQYLGLGSKGLGISICGNPYPINLLRSDT
jgi:hypothetical protein